MKNILKSVLMLLLVVLIACDKGDDISLNPNDNDVLGTGVVQTFSNLSGGTLSAVSGAKIIVPAGSIGNNTEGNSGEVSFSIEYDLTISDIPIQIPSKYQLVGDIVKFSPSSFIFTSPLFVYLSAQSLTSLDGVKILRLDEKNGTWIVVPICDIDANNKLLGASTFELGYFAVVIETNTIGKKSPVLQELHKSGGFIMEHPGSEYYYTILVVSFTPKYSEDAGTGIVGTSGGTGSNTSASGPASVTRLGGIPQGTYGLEISRIRRGTFSTLPGETQYYSNIISMDLGGFSNTQSWDWANWSGWTHIQLSGGDWVTGTPPQWPNPDTPFGTGEFQATLTWVNSYGTGTDIDLHLFGPNGSHVCWYNKNNQDSSIKLDRDWTTGEGYATENIFSTKSIPKGTYSVYANPFSGSVPKNYEVRIIQRGNSVKTFRGTVTTPNKNDDTPNNLILIYTFKI